MVKSKNKQTAPAVGIGPRGEEGRIGYLLRQASVAHRIKVEKVLADLQITLPQYSVLSVCESHPGLSNADLARFTLLTPQTVIVIVKNLEKMGAILRQPHAIHGRIQQIAITQQGKELLSACTKRVLVIQKELLAGFNADEEKIIRRWLVSVAK